MKPLYLLGVDIGTNSCKVVLIQPTGDLIATASEEYPTLYPRSGWAEQHPDHWYAAFKTALGKLVRQTGIASEQVEAVGVTGQMVSLVCLDRGGQVLRDCILWLDQRASAEVVWLKRDLGQKFQEVTCLPINQSFTLPKLLWLKGNEPSIWKALYQVQLPKDYLRYRLTGTWATDVSDASGTMLFDLHHLDWSDRACDMAGVPRDKLPPVARSHQMVGQIQAAAARDLGLREGVPVVAGAADLAADNLATGITKPGQWVTRMGTAGSTSLLLDEPIRDWQGICFCAAHCLPGKYILEVGTHSFGRAYRWFKDTFGAPGSEGDAGETRNPYEIMEELVAEVPVGAGELVFHPFVAGSPYWHPDLRGAFLGILPKHRKSHFARAVLEGTAFTLYDSIALLKNLAQTEMKEYILVGGGSKSATWRQIVCDVLGHDAVVLENCDAALGAAMLAGVGAKVFAGFPQAVARCVKRKLTVQYDPEHHRRYQYLRETFHRTHQFMSGMFPLEGQERRAEPESAKDGCR